MLIHRLIFAALVWAVLLAMPGGSVARGPGGPGDRPLTSAEQTASDRKIAAAEAWLAADPGRGGRLAPLVCVFGTHTDSRQPRGTRLQTLDATGCDVPRGALAVEARDQIRGHYCGPAVGQVISNYAWAIGVNGNKFLQAKLAEWMRTDVNGFTDAFNMEIGLEVATRGAPRRPADWDWVVTTIVDSDRDGTTGDQLHAYVRANISGSKMPLAMSVKPHDPLSRFHLFSWPRPVRSVGHWIAAYGWLGAWTGDDSARIYYTDSSADEGGATGKFWTPTRHIAALIQEHTRRIVW
jgi:hypothetical protein